MQKVDTFTGPFQQNQVRNKQLRKEAVGQKTECWKSANKRATTWRGVSQCLQAALTLIAGETQVCLIRKSEQVRRGGEGGGGGAPEPTPPLAKRRGRKRRGVSVAGPSRNLLTYCVFVFSRAPASNQNRSDAYFVGGRAESAADPVHARIDLNGNDQLRGRVRAAPVHNRTLTNWKQQSGGF